MNSTLAFTVSRPKDVLPELDPDSRARFSDHFQRLLIDRFGLPPDRENEENFRFVCDYIGRYYAGVMHKAAMPTKGLFFFGKPGRGKSAILKAFCRIFIHNIGFLSVWEMAEIFSKQGASGFWGELENYENFPLVIDDLGNESAARSFGATLPVIDLLRVRADLFYDRTPPVLTFFSSNFHTISEIAKVYNESIFSRLAGMVDFVEWRGYDHRLKR